jgi:uncharacterized protein YndB with AHSA1/START domain
MMQKEINQTWFFQQPPPEVWEYLTKPELIGQWLMKADFKPVVGHKFSFIYTPKEDSNYEGSISSEILEVRPYTKLSYSWDGRVIDGGRRFNSVVVWTLVPKEGGTELHLQHKDFTLSEDVFSHSKGWEVCIARLKDSLNKINQ